MSDEEIHLEYEITLADEGKDIKECPKCGHHTHRDHCPECSEEDKVIGLSGDAVIDSTFQRLADGEEMTPEQFDAALRGQQWEPVV